MLKVSPTDIEALPVALGQAIALCPTSLQRWHVSVNLPRSWADVSIIGKSNFGLFITQTKNKNLTAQMQNQSMKITHIGMTGKHYRADQKYTAFMHHNSAMIQRRVILKKGSSKC